MRLTKSSTLLAILSVLLAACTTTSFEINNLNSSDSLGSEDEESSTETAVKLWSTYANENAGFKIEYPKTWVLEEDAHGRPLVFFTSPERVASAQGLDGDQIARIDVMIHIYEDAASLPNNESQLTFDEWIQEEDKYFDGPVSKVDINGVSGYSIENEHFMVENKGKIYELNLNVPHSSAFASERQHMFDSFKFLNVESQVLIQEGKNECSEESCFFESFNTCSSASFQMDLGFAAVSYEIIGLKDELCEVQMTYTKNPNPEWANQPMTCSLDYKNQVFESAIQMEFEAAMNGKGTCTGALADILKN